MHQPHGGARQDDALRADAADARRSGARLTQASGISVNKPGQDATVGDLLEADASTGIRDVGVVPGMERQRVLTPGCLFPADPARSASRERRVTSAATAGIAARLEAGTPVDAADRDQLMRLRRVRKRYPQVVIERPESGGWRARIPVYEGEKPLYALPLKDLLNQVIAADPDGLIVETTIRGRILACEYTGWIPAALDLAEETGLTVTKVQQVERRLASEGLIRTARGLGYYVGNPQAPAVQDPRAWLGLMGDLLTQIATGALSLGDQLPPAPILGQPHGCDTGQAEFALGALERLLIIGRTRKYGPYSVLELHLSQRPGAEVLESHGLPCDPPGNPQPVSQ